jgi:3-hydroxyacyl-[acyl-carrier-protein] dehydratase
MRKKNVSINEDFFNGHFPNKPVMPGVLIIEALGQAAGILGFLTMNKTPDEGSIYYLVGVDNVRFKNSASPGDVIDLHASIRSEKRGIWKFDCKAEVDGRNVCTATILCADRSK